MILKMNSYLRITKKRGYSIIEVAISLALLALILSGMLEVFNRGFSAASKTKQSAVMYNLARQTLEQYSLFSAIPANGTYALAAVILNSTTYNRTLDIADGPCVTGQLCPPNNELKQVTVTVTTGTNTFSLVTLKADY